MILKNMLQRLRACSQPVLYELVKGRRALNVWSQPTDVSIRNGLVVNAMLLCDLMDYPNPHPTKWLGFVGLIATADASNNLKNVFNLLTHRHGLPKPSNIGVDLHTAVLPHAAQYRCACASKYLLERIGHVRPRGVPACAESL